MDSSAALLLLFSTSGVSTLTPCIRRRLELTSTTAVHMGLGKDVWFVEHDNITEIVKVSRAVLTSPG